MPQKWCPGCEQYHPKADFGRNASTLDGLTTYCREYGNRVQREWKKKHAGVVRAEHQRYRRRLKAINHAKRREH